MTTEVQEPLNLQCPYIKVTRLSLFLPGFSPHQPKELVRKIIGALLSLQLNHASPLLPTCSPVTQAHSLILGREDAGGVERESQDVLENEMNIYLASTMFRWGRAL